MSFRLFIYYSALAGAISALAGWTAGRLTVSGEGLLNQGQTKVFRDAKGLRLVIGNAPAVQLVADNHDFGTPQSSGNVAHVTVQPGGDVQFA